MRRTAGGSANARGRRPAPRLRDDARPPLSLVTREFATSRWHDFQELFSKYGGVQSGCWCMFYHREGPNGPLQDAARQERNRLDHRALLAAGHAHGILVYHEDVPVGWCQFGRASDLPRVERGRKYKALAAGLSAPADWRITCFFVDKPYRRSGVAKAALHAALQAMARRGGGIVEAYPALQSHAVATWFGSRSMFEREGFHLVRPFGQSNVLMRKMLARSGRARVADPRTGSGGVGRGARGREIPSSVS